MISDMSSTHLSNSIKSNRKGYSFFVTSARSNCVEEYDIRRLLSSSTMMEQELVDGVLRGLPEEQWSCKWLRALDPDQPVMNYRGGAQQSRIIDFAVDRDGRLLTRQINGKKNFKSSIQGYIRGKILDPYVVDLGTTRKIYDASQAWTVTKGLVTDGAVDGVHVENSIWFCSGRNRNSVLVHENEFKLSFIGLGSCILDVDDSWDSHEVNGPLDHQTFRSLFPR